MNQVALIGRLGRDPELKSTSSGTPVCTISIAVDGAGKDQDEAGWFNVTCWKKLAESVSQYMRKGSKVGVTGRLQQRTWETDGGDNRSVVEVVAFNVDFLDPRQPQAETQTTDSSAPVDDDPFADGNEDDDPFA